MKKYLIAFIFGGLFGIFCTAGILAYMLDSGDSWYMGFAFGVGIILFFEWLIYAMKKVGLL